MISGKSTYLNRLSSRRTCQRGFTLVEIMIVVLMIGVILNIAMPSMIKARNTSQTNSCIGNLKTIQNAKQEWAVDSGQPGSVTPTWSEISPYVSSANQSQPLCPTSQQAYIFGSVDTAATCPTYPVTHFMSSW